MLALSEACERNKEPILQVLRAELASSRSVLEIGSGTGQHAVHFATHLPWLRWQPSEMPELLEPLAARMGFEAPDNILTPIALDVQARPWAVGEVDAIFSANTLHIMSWAAVESFFAGAGAALRAPGVLCLYGPFRYEGAYTSNSNQQFDAWLKARDPLSGLREVSALKHLARAQGLELSADHEMPANNRTLIFRGAPPTRASA